MGPTTPKTIVESVYRLREKIGIDTEPIFLEVKPEGGKKLNDCFEDVARKISRDRGSIQHGWTVWETPGKLIEGEFHAVWVSPDGSFLDVTPKKDGEKRILFIPDPQRVYEKKHIENIRLPLTNDPEVHRMIRMHEEMGELRIKYNDGNGESKIPLSEMIALELKYSPQKQIPVRSTPKIGRNDPCSCGSGKKFKNCHGRTS